MRRFPILVASAAIALAACGDNNQIATRNTGVGSGPIADQGDYVLRHEGCLGCHTIDGSKSSGPTFKDLAGSQVQLDNGSTVTANDSYLTTSIMYPSAETVLGFPKGFMANSINHRKKLNATQINDVIAYLKTISKNSQ